MHNLVGIDGKRVNDKLVMTITVKDEKIDFLDFEINEKNLEYVNLCNLSVKELKDLKKKIDDIIVRETKIAEILKAEGI